MERELFFGLLSILLGALGAIMVCRLGWRLGLVDQSNSRSSHSQPTPKGAGIGLLMAFVLVGVLSGFPSSIWLPVAILSLVSLLGDRFEISPQIRLVVQFAAAGWASHWLFVHSGMISGRGELGISWWLLLAVPYVVATANVYNFMDGINGIAGITGAIAFGLLALAGGMGGESREWVLVAVGLASACIGFLPWNVPRARVFMGDAGSILLGFVFAVYVIAWSRSLADFLLFISFLLLFYADEGATLLVRLRGGVPLTKPHRRHVYQILANQLRIAHWKVASVYGFIQLLVGTVMMILHPHGWKYEIACLTVMSCLFLFGAVKIRKYECRD